MADALIKYETIDENQIKDIMAGQRAEAAGRLGRFGRHARRRSAPRVRPKVAAPIGSPAGQH